MCSKRMRVRILFLSLLFTLANAGTILAQDETVNGSLFIKGPAPWIDVKVVHAPCTSGAVGNGTTDDTSAIQCAINAAGANGGTIFFPPGAYKVTSSLTDTGTTNIELRGAGSAGWGSANPALSRIVTTNAGPILNFGSSSSSNPGGVHIVHLGFQDTSGTGSAVGAIKIQREYHIQMQDVSCADFSGSSSYCIQLNSTSGDWVQYGSFIDIKSRNTTIGFQALGPSTDMVIVGGHFTAPSSFTGSIGIDIEQPTDSVAYNTDTYQILNPSLEGFQTAIKIYNGDGHRITARIENTGTTPPYHQGTGILIDGSLSHQSTANTIIGTIIDGPATGIQLCSMTGTACAAKTQIIGTSISNVATGFIVDNSTSKDTLILANDTIAGSPPGSGGARLKAASGAPSGSCSTGSLYLRTDGGLGSTLYVCESAGWTAK